MRRANVLSCLRNPFWWAILVDLRGFSGPFIIYDVVCLWTQSSSSPSLIEPPIAVQSPLNIAVHSPLNIAVHSLPRTSWSSLPCSAVTEMPSRELRFTTKIRRSSLRVSMAASCAGTMGTRSKRHQSIQSINQSVNQSIQSSGVGSVAIITVLTNDLWCPSCLNLMSRSYQASGSEHAPSCPGHLGYS